MKLFSALFFAGSLALAAGAGDLDFKCRSEAKNGRLIQIKLRQLSQGSVREGVKTPFELAVETLNSVMRDRIGELKVFRGFLETEDVMVHFNSLDKKVNLTLYLDELEQTILSIKGKPRVQLECDEHRW